MSFLNKAGFKEFLLKLAGAQFKEIVLFSFVWDKIVGKGIAKRASIEKYEKGTLFVSVSNNVWLQELVLMKEKLIKKLSKATGVTLKDIIFYIKYQKELKWVKKR